MQILARTIKKKSVVATIWAAGTKERARVKEVLAQNFPTSRIEAVPRIGWKSRQARPKKTFSLPHAHPSADYRNVPEKKEKEKK